MAVNRSALRIRREYNQWVANETLEDYALRYTAKRARRWSSAWVANTALGIVSFLALEAIGGTVTLAYGFDNALWAILVVGAIIFLSGLPLSYYAARDGVDIDLLTRGAGFGYIGSTVSSLVYASFTFIFFALEAAIMSMAIHMMTGLPLSLAYVASALVVIPLVTHGISRISRFQAWTQPLWLALQILPLLVIAREESALFSEWIAFPGLAGRDGAEGFDLLLFGAAAAVIFPLIAQNGEQADFLRFLPDRSGRRGWAWWAAVVGAGPGWVVFGVAKLLAGSFLAVLALEHGLPPGLAADPAHMYTVAFGYLTRNPELALWLAGGFVIVSQLKINVTNAYAGSIAWANFFSRLTHSHPGRVVWLVFNVAIALLLMELGLYQAFETILVTYASLVVAWVGSVVADLVINKPLGLSPQHIEFRRGHLYDINPVGVGSMVLASGVGISASLGLFGETAQALAPFLALSLPFMTVPAIAWATGGRYYLARSDDSTQDGERAHCAVCENPFDREDMVRCPSYAGDICSLCCALDARCGDQCRPHAHVSAQTRAWLSRILPGRIHVHLDSVIGRFLAIFAFTAAIIAALLAIVFFAQQERGVPDLALVGATLWQVFFLLLLLIGVLIWFYVLAQRSARLALEEIRSQAELLAQEVEAHEQTAVELARARDAAHAANQAKSRYLSGVSHELRTPLNTILGYAQLMEGNARLDGTTRKVASVIRRSSEHLADVIDGLLEISKIEARKLDLCRDTFDLRGLIQQLDDMFRPLAARKGLDFQVVFQGEVPAFVTGDEKRVRQILMNLLSNAVKFTPAGMVELRMSYRNEVAHFVVRDTGIGIDEVDQKRIFEPFERVRNDATRAISGTGLGLSICHLLTEMMGGSLELESWLGEGSEFHLRLFLPAVQGFPESQTRTMGVNGYLGPAKRILVVDDEKEHRALIADLLEPLGFEVCQAESGQGALELARASSIDLCLLDISMPGMDGWEVLRRLRGIGVDAPVIVLSAESKEFHTPGEKLDCDAFLQKPVQLEKLLERIGQCLQLGWCYESGRTGSTSAGDAVGRVDPKIRTRLRECAAMGYLKGVQECIAELESSGVRPGWLAHVRELTESYDLEAVARVMDEVNESESGVR